mmetsp:Transcript_13510/g.20499  ORF Transcript_13510/g.20499 Transcript_13510/m.20499 type:complete len:680 (+) Transcript_13510:220-2259(+)
MRKSIFFLNCEQKRLAQLFLLTALCIHRQVCQCYAGGGGSVSRIKQSWPPALISNLSSHIYQPYSQLENRNCRGISIRGGGFLHDKGRSFDFRLRQASIATSIEDDEDNAKRLSIRGGTDIPEEGLANDAHVENVDNVKSASNSNIENPAETGHDLSLEQAEFLEHPKEEGAVDYIAINAEVNDQSITGHGGNEEISSIVENADIVQSNDQVTKEEESVKSVSRPTKWPCGDKLDRELIKIALPCIANFAINPLVGAVDLFWINRMGNTLAVAGQAAANQIFSSSFWLTSFLPSVTATLVAKECARGSEEGIQDSVCQALIVGTFIAILGSFFILSQPDRLLGGVLSADAPARQFARPYLFIRGFAFLPSMFSLIGFSAFRGVMDTVTPLKISLFANLLNAILDPIFIFTLKLGVTGAALATLAAEITSAFMFTMLLWRRNMITPSKLFRLPKWANLSPLLRGGAALQLRNFALNLTFLAVTRVTQSIDNTGVAATAHAMAIQTFQIGGIVLLALSTVAQTVVPNAMIEKIDSKTGEKTGGMTAARVIVSRLMRWGFILGTVLGSLQTLLIPYLQKSTPVIAVREAARVPALLASVYQVINGLVFIGEGVMVGCSSFFQLSLSTLVATIATVLALNKFPSQYGLTGVWMSFGVFNTLRLLGVFIHQKISGPLIEKVEEC